MLSVYGAFIDGEVVGRCAGRCMGCGRDGKCVKCEEFYGVVGDGGRCVACAGDCKTCGVKNVEGGIVF